MKEPKKLESGRIQLWMGYRLETKNTGLDRFRIIFPNGEVLWTTAARLKNTVGAYETDYKPNPCWNNFKKKISKKKFKKAIENMKKYDSKFERKTIFLGYL